VVRVSGLCKNLSVVNSSVLDVALDMVCALDLSS